MFSDDAVFLDYLLVICIRGFQQQHFKGALIDLDS